MSELKNRIPCPEGSDGQQPQWPGEPPEAPAPGTETIEKDGTRAPEKISVPIVR